MGTFSSIWSGGKGNLRPGVPTYIYGSGFGSTPGEINIIGTGASVNIIGGYTSWSNSVIQLNVGAYAFDCDTVTIIIMPTSGAPVVGTAKFVTNNTYNYIAYDKVSLISPGVGSYPKYLPPNFGSFGYISTYNPTTPGVTFDFLTKNAQGFYDLGNSGEYAVPMGNLCRLTFPLSTMLDKQGVLANLVPVEIM